MTRVTRSGNSLGEFLVFTAADDTMVGNASFPKGAIQVFASTAARRFAAATLTALVCFGSAIALAGPARAHDVLVSSSPAAGEEVAVAPERIELEFNAIIAAEGAAIEAVDDDERLLTDGDIRIDGMTASVALVPDVSAGDVTVKWRVVSSDGHPISGDFAFIVTEGATTLPDSEGSADEDPSAPESGAQDEGSATPTDSSTTPAATPNDTESTTPNSGATPTQAADEPPGTTAEPAQEPGTNLARTALLVLGGVAIGIGVYFAWARRRKDAGD